MYAQWKANGALYGEEIGYFVIFEMQENIVLAAVLGEYRVKRASEIFCLSFTANFSMRVALRSVHSLLNMIDTY